jgi:septal ring factor EnvC (AmiA/AmiB activator)
MEKWEDEGFASEEAYKKYQQTIKDLKEDKEKLDKQVLEKQTLIDENRTKISGLSESVKELDGLKAAAADAEVKRKAAEETEAKRKAEALKEPEAIAALNQKRIGSLDTAQREALEKSYKEATPEQQAMLVTPEGLAAYLDLKVGPVQGTILNPFAVKRSSELTVKEQVARIFKIVDANAPPALANTGAGFVPSEKIINNQQKYEDNLEKERADLLY